MSSADRTATSPSSASAPAGGQAFVLEYTARAQRPLGTDLRRIDSTLIVRGEKGEASLEKHRSQSDRAGEPIGTFRGEVSAELLASLRDKARQTLLAELPPRGGGPGTTVLTLRFEQGEQKVTHVFNSGDMAILKAFRGLLDELNQLRGQLDERPLCAMQASLKYKGGSSPHFLLTLTNIGKERICFADPRFLPSDDVDCWAGAQVAELPEEKPGVTSPPLKWARLPLERPAGPAPGAPVVLKPGKSFSAQTVPWRDGRPERRYLALGAYSDYTGPAEIDGVYRIRGATFSEGLEFQAK